MAVGIDIGGTTTRIRVAGPPDRDASLPTAEWRSGTLLSDPANAARLVAAIPKGATGGLAVGAHGCDTRYQCETFAAHLRDHWPGPVLVVNDSELFGPALGLRPALAVVCGTGSIVVGRTAAGDIVKVGGFGWLLGDPGGAPGIVRRAVVALLAADDRGEPPGDLARRLHVSESQLARRFKAETGQTVTRYITAQRMARAAHLLATTAQPVRDIAEFVGYADANYFVKVFKSVYATTPTQYRRAA